MLLCYVHWAERTHELEQFQELHAYAMGEKQQFSGNHSKTNREQFSAGHTCATGEKQQLEGQPAFLEIKTKAF